LATGGVSLIWLCLLLGLSPAFTSVAFADNFVHRSNRGEPTTLDPHKTPNGWETTIDLELFMGLTSGSAEAKVLPGMAESWSADDDGLGFTFHLRDGLKWSDGEPLTAEDFVWSFRRMLDPATASPYASLHYPIINARAVNTGAMPPSALGVHAPDPRTVSIRLSRPAPYYPQILIHRGLPAPRHAIEKFGDDWTKAGVMVSNGAFTLAEWVPQTHVRVDRNARFFDAANVKIDGQYFIPAENAQSAFQMVRSGQLDTLVGFPPEQIDLIRRELPDFLRLHPLLGVEYIVFNVKRAPFSDRRVRQALSMLIDRDVIAGKVLGTGERPAWSMVHPETMLGTKALRPALLAGSAAERLARARALLDDAGFGRDKPLAFEFRTSANDIVRRMAVAVTAMWKAAGVEARIVNSDMPVLFSDIREGNFSVARAEWYPEVVDPETYLYLMQSSSGPMNQSGYANADFDRAMDVAAAEGDAERRLELYRAAEEIAAGDQPLAPVFFYAGRTLVNPRVSGWADHTRNLHPGRFLSIK
jgi:oligopeptide transport system substrate-binding protein